jgi:hypothetical protein
MVLRRPEWVQVRTKQQFIFSPWKGLASGTVGLIVCAQMAHAAKRGSVRLR